MVYLIWAIFAGFVGFMAWRLVGNPFHRARVSKQHEGQVRCLMIRDRERGGIVDEWKPKAEIPPGTPNRVIFSAKMPVIVDIQDAALASFSLPDEVIITPEKVARIPGCDPWQRYKTTVKTIWDNLRPMVPVVVIVINAILLVILKG